MEKIIILKRNNPDGTISYFALPFYQDHHIEDVEAAKRRTQDRIDYYEEKGIEESPHTKLKSYLEEILKH